MADSFPAWAKSNLIPLTGKRDKRVGRRVWELMQIELHAKEQENKRLIVELKAMASTIETVKAELSEFITTSEQA